MTHIHHDPNVVKNRKYISWILILAVISIFLSGRIQFWMPEYSHMDQVKYRTMSEAFPFLSTEVIQPFAYRVLAPWLAGAVPFKTEISFYILSVSSLLLLSFLLYKFLILNNVEYRISFALTVCFIFNRYFFQFNAWNYFQLADILSLITIILALINLYKRDWIYLLIIFCVSILIKETILVLIPITYVYLYINKARLGEYFSFSLITFCTLVLYGLLRFTFIDITGETLWEQFYSGLKFFFTIESFSKKILVAFLPFGLVPFIFYKESISFFKENPHFLILLLFVLLSSFFGDAERLMAPFSPVYYVLIGYIIQRFLTEEINKNYLRKFLLYLIILSFLSSFYHLWGLIKLPSSYFSMITTGILTLITAVLFWRLKLFKTIA